jgi:hypothetical protein
VVLPGDRSRRILGSSLPPPPDYPLPAARRTGSYRGQGGEWGKRRRPRARPGARLRAFTRTAIWSAQARILHVYRSFLNSEIGAAEAGKAQVLGLWRPRRTQGTLGLFIITEMPPATRPARRQLDVDAAQARPGQRRTGRAVTAVISKSRAFPAEWSSQSNRQGGDGRAIRA